MLQHMRDAAGASGSVKVEKRTEQRPAQARAVGDRLVDGLDRGDHALYQTNGFVPYRHLQTVGDMTFDFLVDPDDLLARRRIKRHRFRCVFGRCEAAATDLYQRDDLGRIEWMTKDNSFRMLRACLNLADCQTRRRCPGERVCPCRRVDACYQ